MLPPEVRGMKTCSNLGHMTNMADMSIYNKTFIIFSPEAIDLCPSNLVCRIPYTSAAKIVRIMTLG